MNQRLRYTVTLNAVARAAMFAAVLCALCLNGTTALAQSDTLVVRATAAPCLVIRASPESTAPKRDCVVPGTKLPAVASAPYWRQVVLPNGQKGWAAKQYLELRVSAAPSVVGDTTKWMEIHFVDVGQGDGIWIRTADDGVAGNGIYDGKSIVIDGGPDRTDTKNAMYKYMAAVVPEHTPIDAMIITHPHDDHYPGAWGLLNHYPVRDFYDSGYPKTGTMWAAFMAAARTHAASLHIGRDNFGTLDWGRELQVEVLYAYPGQPAGLGSGNTLENNASIVLKLTYGSESFLFMGDAEGKERDDSPAVPKFAEAILLHDPAKLKATVLKIAHHGSETSSTLPFINAVDPDYVVVMSGRKSFDGTFLPDKTTLARYCAHKPSTKILRTDQDDEAEQRTTATDADGDNVVIRTNGVRLIVEAYSHGNRISADACTP